jgi:uncharacterized protein (DUF1015 family)
VDDPGTGTASHKAQLLLRPFRGLRYNSEQIADLGAVTSPPYDVMDRPMIEELLRRHPRNVVRLVLPRLVADPMHADDPNVHAAKQLQRWTDQDVLRPDPQPALYVYEYGDGETRVCGLIGALELRKRTERTIFPHEDVIADIVADRLAMMSAAQANLEPILLVYDGAGSTARLLSAAREATPLIDVTEHTTRSAAGDAAARHRLWAITDPRALRELQELLAPHQALIADGHHRYAAYLELRRRHRLAGCKAGPWDRGLALLIDSSQYPLHLGAIHRSVADVHIQSVPEPPGYVLGPLRDDPFDFDHPPTDARVLVLTDGRRWRTLTSQTAAADAVTDAELLHLQVLASWRIGDDQLGYHHTPQQAVSAAARDGGVAILLHPAKLENVMQVAATGRTLPRKSTSFGPKPRTGLVLRRFADDG